MKPYFSPQSGLSLVELMIAVTLGLLVTSAVFAMYLGTSRSFTQDERYAWMQENGRYALNVLIEDLSMADFWGQMTAPDTIVTALAPPAGNCSAASGMFDLFDATTALLFNNYHASPANTHFTPCAGITDDQVAETDILVIKRVEGADTAAMDLKDGDVYLRTNGTSGNFIDDAKPSNPPALGERDWRYIPRVYFVRDHYETLPDDTPADDTPALCRMAIDGTGLGTPECVAEGVEDLHVQFGVDTDGDGVVNEYLPNSTNPTKPTSAEMEAVVTLRIYLLVRSVEPDPTYTNSKIYILGNEVVPAANDNFYRRVYTTTVSLRNPLNLNLLN